MTPDATGLGYAGLLGGSAERELAIEEDAKAESERRSAADPRLCSCKAVIGCHIQATDGEVGHVDGLDPKVN